MSTPTQWNIDASHSNIEFSVRHMVISKVRGRFTKFNGVVTFDEADVAQSKVTASIDAASIDTGTAQRDTHLKSADFFDVEKFPELKFHSARIEKTGKHHYRVVGPLTMHGVTREVTLEVEATGTGVDPWGNPRMGFVAKTSLNRTDFGLTWNQMLEAGGVLVAEEISIELDIQAVKAAATKAA
ncbi:MAG: YceI family protein [Myxococcaceae bacterium]|nr:YceI family protein [Myxococcaceae bacterium]